MPQKHTVPSASASRASWSHLALLFSLVTLGTFLGQLAASAICFSGIGDVGEAMKTAVPPKWPLLMLQAIVSSSAFIVAPLLYLYVFMQQRVQTLFPWNQRYSVPLLLTLGLVLVFMVINTWFIQWNAVITLPHWLKTFEIWAQEKEAALQKITTLLTTFRSLEELGGAIVVIGVIPAIGEELLFRGLVQKICHELTSNIHLAIGISAFIFSAIHLQFYGFLPRFLLGTLFGYIYWWTKDLLFPIAAHFFNNAFTLIILFLHQRGLIEQDIVTLQAPSMPVFMFCVVMAITLATLLRHQKSRTY
ncbi:MAG: CPBP family intramembrane metalloprotease [Amoebophilaceae bacterium]|jgi:hypothetical protein|nr:CPBP family intramembrane metalloprotease [Amoebophilaceae bacterium]